MTPRPPRSTLFPYTTLFRSVTSGTTVNVVIQYYTPPTSTDVNTAKGLGASNGKAIGLVKGYGWAMSQGNVSSLISKDSNIKYVSLDRKLQSAMNYAVPAMGADIALSMGYD